MKDKARSRTYYSLARERLTENYPKIFSFLLIMALISLTGLAVFLISDLLSFGSDSAHKGALVGIDLQDRGKSILAFLNGNDERTNLISQDQLSEPNKASNDSADANISVKERGPENLSAQVESSNSSRTGTLLSQSQVSGSATAGGTVSSSSSDKQTKKRKVNSSNRRDESSASSAESSNSAEESDDRLNQTQMNNTQQIQTTISQSQQNQSRINDSQINASQASESKMEISSSSNVSGDFLAAEPANIETKTSVNLSSQDNIDISADSGLDRAKDASELPEVRLEFKTNLAIEPKSENVQNPEEMSSGAASSGGTQSDLQVAESIQAEEIHAVAESPKSSTIEFKPAPQKKKGDSSKTSRLTTSSSRTQKKLQIAKTQPMTDRNKRSTNLMKKSTQSRTNPRSKKPSG